MYKYALPLHTPALMLDKQMCGRKTYPKVLTVCYFWKKLPFNLGVALFDSESLETHSNTVKRNYIV